MLQLPCDTAQRRAHTCNHRRAACAACKAHTASDASIARITADPATSPALPRPTSLMMSAALWKRCIRVHWNVLHSEFKITNLRSLVALRGGGVGERGSGFWGWGAL